MLQFSTIDFATPEYDESITLRHAILREPLGITFHAEDLAEEWNQFHLAGYDEQEKLQAILVLKPVSEGILKMRQVAVKENNQGKGYGTSLVKYSEVWAKYKGYKKFELHARETAVPFYLNLGYKKVGKPFMEVSVPHYKMTKSL